MAEEVVQSFQGPARARKETLTADIQPLLSFTGDEKAIRQLLSILMDNGVKYAPEGGAISVRLRREGRCLRLTVSNTTAQPVERDKLPLLFDRFYRAEESRTSGGFGIGLSIARSLTELQGGTFELIVDGGLFKALLTMPQAS